MASCEPYTTAIILSGGAATRFDGVDKGLQQYKAKTLIEHVIERIEPQVNQLIICANRNIKHYERLGFKVVIDELDDYQGPMSGIYSAIKSPTIDAHSKQVLISSCDVPAIPRDIKSRLETGFLKKHHSNVAIAHDGTRRQNLHCLIKQQAWSSLIDFFENGGRAMHHWFNELSTTNVDFSNDAPSFVNINTAEQLMQLNTDNSE